MNRLGPGAAVALAALLTAACAGPSYPISAPTPAPTPPTPPPPIETRQATPARPPASAAKACNASEFQNLIGRPRTDIPVPLNPGRQRVTCTTCPVADNVDPGRLNFLFDAQTGLIKEVRCG